MQKQIDALREAFSADTSRPFELKPGFPYGSPGFPALQPTPPLDPNYQISALSRHESQGQIAQRVPFQTSPITPPMTAGLEGSQDGPVATAAVANSHPQLVHEGSMGNGQAAWNPTSIFE